MDYDESDTDVNNLIWNTIDQEYMRVADAKTSAGAVNKMLRNMNVMKNQAIAVIAAATTAIATAALPNRSAMAATACVIPNSACYPWRIPAGSRETTLLDIIPNNAVTGAIYRICLCPPEKSVELIFRFGGDDIVVGEVTVSDAGPVCRDFRFETSRRSQLSLRRPQSADEPLAGCYVTAPSGR